MEDKQLRETVAAYIKENKRQALAEVITEWLQPGHLTIDLMRLFLDSKALNAGDSLLYKVRKGLSVRTLVPGQIPLKDEITVSERMAYVLDMADIAVNASEWELQSGELGTVADIKSEMQKKIAEYYVNKSFTALTTVWTAATTPDNYTDCAGNLTATALKNMVDRINQTTPGAKMIVGSRVALTPITTFGGFWTNGTTVTEIPSAIEEIFRTGWLGQYYGVPILSLDQIYDNEVSYSKLIPEDKVLVIGKNVGSFITYGPVGTKEYTDMKPTPPVWNYELYQQFGLVVLNALGIGVLAVS